MLYIRHCPRCNNELRLYSWYSCGEPQFAYHCDICQYDTSLSTITYASSTTPIMEDDDEHGRS